MKKYIVILNAAKNLLLPVLTLLCLSLSCKRIPLYDPETDVFLKLDLQLRSNVELDDNFGDIDPNSSLGEKVYGKIPSTVQVLFYNSLNHELVSEDFLPIEGGFINVPAGTYDLIVYGMGMEATQVAGLETRGGAYSFTSQTDSKVKISKVSDDPNAEPGTRAVEEYNVIYEPDHIYVARKEGVVIPVHANIDQTVVIEAEMTPLLDTYTFEVLNVEGAERVRKADVYITGQAPARYLWDGRYPGKPCAIYFQAEADAALGHINTVFNTFGKLSEAQSTVYLNVAVTDSEGGKYQWIYDVTDQFDNPDNTRHHIVISDPIVIPSGGGSGFTTSVNGWDVDITEIDM